MSGNSAADRWQRITPPVKQAKGKVYVSFQPSGRMVMSVDAYKQAGEPEKINVYYNAVDRQVMIVPCPSNAPADPDTFTVRLNKKGDYIYGMIYSRELIALCLPLNANRALKVAAQVDQQGRLIVNLPADPPPQDSRGSNGRGYQTRR